MSDHAASPHAHAHNHDAKYVRIWAILCALLVVSVIGPMAGIRVVTLITAFGIAIIKAYLVTKHFMHLNIERRWVTYILLGMIAFMVVFFGGVSPDVLRHQGERWQKTYQEPAVTHGEHGAEPGAEHAAEPAGGR